MGAEMALPMKSKAMKAMKAMKSMKAMKKAMGVGKKSSVFKGIKEKTGGGLKKGDLVKSKRGKVVSKKSSAAGKKAYKHIKAWTDACQKARKELSIKGFVAIKKGTPFYKAAKAHYNA